MQSSPVLTLTCSCCTSSTPGRQWHNRDEGFGLCGKCAEWLSGKETPAIMQSTYGIAGYHYPASSNAALSDLEQSPDANALSLHS